MLGELKPKGPKGPEGHVLSTEGLVVGLCWAKLKPKGPKGTKGPEGQFEPSRLFPSGVASLLGEFLDLVSSRNRDAFLKPSRTFERVCNCGGDRGEGAPPRNGDDTGVPRS